MIKWWKNLIERLAESNRKEFGSKRLDCCDLNKKK
ncbi:MAG TPA: LDCC motif putative metal-binding protein [Proteiniclasticum sp.]|nr:LDCC motif putative metal-binding protein [Proteiniclasticum sp.]